MKLRILEDRYEAIRNKPMTNELARELTLRSLRQTINQFKEESSDSRVASQRARERVDTVMPAKSHSKESIISTMQNLAANLGKTVLTKADVQRVLPGQLG